MKFLQETGSTFLFPDKSGYYTSKGIILSLKNHYDFGATTMVIWLPSRLGCDSIWYFP